LYYIAGYYHYVEATGSILQVNENGDVREFFMPCKKNYYRCIITKHIPFHFPIQTDDTFNQLQRWKDSAREPGTSAEEQDQQKVLTCLHHLQLRYFSPREVGNLMGFPASFGFPETMSLKQKYRTLGNSINVLVVGELMKYLVKEGSSMEPAAKMRKLEHSSQ
jgi:tRNA (cytosine38-C5)-methyltransferase